MTRVEAREVRRRLANALDTAGVLAPAARLRERWIAARAPAGDAVGPDGLPLPPARLRVLVDGHGDANGFMTDSAHAALMIRDTLGGAGVRLEELGSVLDFGCGCGRVARNWAGLSGPELHGCDYNPQLVEWCRDNLPFVRVRVNGSEPPSPYDDDSFDLVYAISILTHLTEPQALAWMADFRRILKPGGLLLLTLHGDAFTQRLGADERERYERGEVVVQRSGTAGMNVCAAYHPASYVTGTLLAGLELAAHRTGRLGSFPQDAWLARRPAS